MDHSEPNWYVQLRSGPLLGPMSHENLLSLVQAGSVLGNDQVREGTDGDWLLVSDVPGMLDLEERRPSAAAVEDVDEIWGRSVSNNLINLDESDFELNLPQAPEESGVVPPSDPEPAEAPLQAADPPPANEERVETETSGTKLSESESVETETVPTEPAESVPIPAREIRREQESRPTLDASAAVPPPPHFAITAGRARPGPRRLTSAVGVLLVIGLVVLVTVLLVPRRDEDIYQQYSAIVAELDQRRAESEDADAWEEFVVRSRTVVDETIPWLEENAHPGDRGASLLLYVGRDLREMFEYATEPDADRCRRVQGFMEQLDELYAADEKR